MLIQTCSSQSSDPHSYILLLSGSCLSLDRWPPGEVIISYLLITFDRIRSYLCRSYLCWKMIETVLNNNWRRITMERRTIFKADESKFIPKIRKKMNSIWDLWDLLSWCCKVSGWVAEESLGCLRDSSSSRSGRGRRVWGHFLHHWITFWQHVTLNVTPGKASGNLDKEKRKDHFARSQKFNH